MRIDIRKLFALVGLVDEAPETEPRSQEEPEADALGPKPYRVIRGSGGLEVLD